MSNVTEGVVVQAEKPVQLRMYGFVTGEPVEVVAVGPCRGCRGKVVDFASMLVHVELENPPQVVRGYEQWLHPWHIRSIAA